MRVVVIGWLLGCLVGSIVAAPALGQVDARQRVEQAAFVIREAGALSLRTEARNEKSMFPGDIRAALTVRMQRLPEEEKGGWKIRYSGKVTGLAGAGVGGSDSLDLELLEEGKYLTWLDHDKQEAHTKLARVAKGPVVHMMGFGAPFMDSLTGEEPYSETLAAEELTIEGTEEIAGETCDIVQSRDPERGMVTRWYFGQSDHLPRRYETILGDMQLHTVCEIREWRVNPEFEPGALDLPVPEGFDHRDSRPRRVSVTDREPGPQPRRARNPIGTDVGDKAPGWELKTPGGDQVALESLQGNVVVLDFFGSWCIPAEDAAPHLQRLADHFDGKPVKVFGLACKEASPEAPQAWMEDMGVSYGLLLDADQVARTYQVRQYPTRFVIGFNGEILHTSKGFDPSENPFPAITSRIEEYLENPPPPPGGRAARPDEDDGN